MLRRSDPLWSGIERLPNLNAQAARRCPLRRGPLHGLVAVFCGLLPLVWAIRQKADGVVARAYRDRDPALLDLARRLVRDGLLNELRGRPVEQALARLWEDLCSVACYRPGQHK